MKRLSRKETYRYFTTYETAKLTHDPLDGTEEEILAIVERHFATPRVQDLIWRDGTNSPKSYIRFSNDSELRLDRTTTYLHNNILVVMQPWSEHTLVMTYLLA